VYNRRLAGRYFTNGQATDTGEHNY